MNMKIIFLINFHFFNTNFNRFNAKIILFNIEINKGQTLNIMHIQNLRIFLEP
jgi:hypothetical protein